MKKTKVIFSKNQVKGLKSDQYRNRSVEHLKYTHVCRTWSANLPRKKKQLNLNAMGQFCIVL